MFVLSILFSLSNARLLAGQTVTERTLLPGTANATPYYIIKSDSSGPVVLITAGVHGSERAPIQAAEQIRKWTITKGTLIVIPRCNIRACNNGTREGGGIDLNRTFPSSSGEKASGSLATALLNLMKNESVDWLMDLHEGLDFSTGSTSSVGQSIIYMPGSKGSETFATKLATTLNKTISSKGEKFELLKYPTKGSLARGAAEVHGIRSLIFETCRQDTLSTRVEFHRTAVVELLKYLNMK